MKLAEALQERADLNTKINELRCRLGNNATVQEGEAPAEDPNELIFQLDECAARLEELIARISATNCATVTEKGPRAELNPQRGVISVNENDFTKLMCLPRGQRVFV